MGWEQRKHEHGRKKPTGTIGFLQIGPGGASYNAEKWPESKPEIERYILDKAISIAHEQGQDLYQLVEDPVQNNEQDIDFTLHTQGGTEYLDLMETAQGPYSMVAGNYIVGERADSIWAKIRGKMYGASNPVHLLLYPTHWTFQVGPPVTDLLGFWSLSRRHNFKSIIFVDVVSSLIVPIFPRPREDFTGFNERAARRTRILKADMTKFQVEPRGVSVPLGPRTLPKR